MQIPEPIKSLWFENAEKEPLSWLETAHSLKLAAEFVINGPLYKSCAIRAINPDVALADEEVLARQRLLFIQGMLAGMGIECLLKGIIVAKEKKLDNWVKSTHNLLELAKRAKVLNKCNDSDQNFLERFGIYVVWAGRYPVPKTAEKMEYPPIQVGSDEVSFRQLFDRLSQVLEAERKEKKE